LNFESFSEFLLMDGHALYVWLSYGMGLFIIVFSYVQPVLARKSLIRDLAQRQRREEQGSSQVNTTVSGLERNTEKNSGETCL